MNISTLTATSFDQELLDIKEESLVKYKNGNLIG